MSMQSPWTVLARRWGDVNGDGFPETVYLIGDASAVGSGFYENIRIMIQDGRTGQFSTITLESNAGYNPRLFLGDFTGDGVDDIYVGIDSGGSGGYGFFYVYSFLHNQSRKLFDYEEFNGRYMYRVVFRDQYRIDVINQTLNILFIIDISAQSPDYLREIYDENGRLRHPIEGSVLGVGQVYPVDYNADGVYDLLAMQRVIGRYNSDTLGYVQTFLQWDGQAFATQVQSMIIPGNPLAVAYTAR